MFDGNFRSQVSRSVDPVGRALHRVGITADVLTVVGIGMSMLAAYVIGSGHLRWGLVAIAASGLPDLLDGAVAKAAGTSSKRGAFFDSCSDRVSDAFVLLGIAWYLDVNHPGQISLLPMAILGAAQITSYVRCKGELLGYDSKGGVLERAERVIMLGLGLAFSRFLIPILWVTLALSILTILQRFIKVWKQATAEHNQKS